MVPSRPSSHTKEVYNPKAVFPHAASLGQGFPHCPIFPTAASRRSLDRISVPVWPFTLSGRLPVVALVSRYLTNQLIGHEHLIGRDKSLSPSGIRGISSRFQLLSPSQWQLLMHYSPVRYYNPLQQASMDYRSTCMC